MTVTTFRQGQACGLCAAAGAGESGGTGAAAGVQIVHDPDQSAAISDIAAAVASRNNVLVCNPSPGGETAAALYTDLLVGLGKDRRLALAEAKDAARIGALVQVWLRAWEVLDLIVLRADTVPDDVWPVLLSLPIRRIWLISRVRLPETVAAHHVTISAAGFVGHWGCPHQTSRVEAIPPRRPDVPASALRLFTLLADIRRHTGVAAEDLTATLCRDIADARAMLAQLCVVHEFQGLQFTGNLRDRQDAWRCWQPNRDRIGDPASLAAALCGYLATTNPRDRTRCTLRLRAVQLALLEYGWLLSARGSDSAVESAPVVLDTMSAKAINRLTDPSVAGYLALAYSAALPAAVIAQVGGADIQGGGAWVRLEERVWPVHPLAVPFTWALALAAPTRYRPAQLESRLQAAAASVGLPPPSLPPSTATSAMHPWLAAHQFTLAALPEVSIAAPDPVDVAFTRAIPGHVSGVVASEDGWP
jgi:hypothetical protein